jgi:hypothetical protein
MPFDPYLSKQLLDWMTGAAGATQPSSRFISFATASPTTQSAFDGPFSPRATVTFAGANSPQMSVTNVAAFSNVTATAAGTAVGWNLWDRPTGGTRLMFGTATAVIGCKSADNIAIAAGQIKITLS